MNPTDTAEIASQVMARSMGDETVLLDLASGTYYSLNPVGARFWQLAGTGQTLGQIRDAILAEYDVEDARLDADLAALVADLIQKKLLVVRSGNA